MQVNVEVNDVQVDSTSLVIPFNAYLDSITPVRIIPEHNRPWGVAVIDDGHIIICDNYHHSVIVLDKDGKKVKSFGEGSENVKFFYPGGVAIISDNFILVADIQKIQKKKYYICW